MQQLAFNNSIQNLEKAPSVPVAEPAHTLEHRMKPTERAPPIPFLPPGASAASRDPQVFPGTSDSATLPGAGRPLPPRARL